MGAAGGCTRPHALVEIALAPPSAELDPACAGLDPVHPVDRSVVSGRGVRPQVGWV